MNIPGLAAVVCALVLFGAPLRAQTVSDVVTARETLKGLEAAAARADSDKKARVDASVLLGKLGPQITKLETPDGEPDTARLMDLRKLSKNVSDTLARERNGQPAEDLRREAKELSAAFTKLYPERVAPPAQAGSRSGGAETVPATAEQAAARGERGGQAAISQPRQFYDGGKTAAGPEAAVAPAGGVSSNGTRRRLKLSPPTAPVGLREAPVPPAPAESAETKACREAMRDHPEDADGCVTSPSLTPLKAGLFDSIKEQFGTVKGLAMNLGFLLMGLAMSVLSGFGLIAKTVVTIASVGLLLWTLPPLLKQGWDAAWKFGQTNAGDPEHSRALLTLGKLGGTVLIMALMSVIGWGVGKTLTQGATTKIAALLEARGVKSPLTAIDAAAPPALTALLTPKVKPVAAGGVEPIPRSAKSAAQVSEATVRRNAGITDREVRIGETMKQLDVDRGFAEKVADAHEQVPCPVGTCTPAQLRAKVEIMGRGPKADAAIRAGLAGEPPAPVPPVEGPAPVPGKAPALEPAPKAAPFIDTSSRFTPSTAQRAPAPSRFNLEEYMRATSRGAAPLERAPTPVVEPPKIKVTEKVGDHFYEDGVIESRQAGVKTGHLRDSFNRTLEGQGRVISEQAVPGYKGLSLVKYKLFKEFRGKPTAELKAGEPLAKTVIDDPALWPKGRISALAREVFGRELHEPAATPSKTTVVKVTKGKVHFVGWVDKLTGELNSFGVDSVDP